MSSAQAEREHIEDLQTDEKRAAEEEVYATFARMEAERAGSQGARAPTPAAVKPERAAEPAAPSPARSSSDIFDQSDIELCEVDSSMAKVDGSGSPVPAEAEAVEVPAPRTEGTNKVTFGFTPRIFPTPARESKAAEENEWISKNRAHLR